MESILPTEEYKEVEGRAYLNPQVGLDESNTFIENLRASQGKQNQEIFSDTQKLGTDIPTNLGGLTGANSYFTSRYQTPQTNTAVSGLRAAAQAQALSEVLSNQEAMWKKRYQDAYRNYQKKQYDKLNYGGNGNPGQEYGKGDVEELATDTEQEFALDGATTSRGGLRTVTGPDGITHIIDDVTGEEVTLRPGERIVQNNTILPQTIPDFMQNSPLYDDNGLFTTNQLRPEYRR